MHGMPLSASTSPAGAGVATVAVAEEERVALPVPPSEPTVKLYDITVVRVNGVPPVTTLVRVPGEMFSGAVPGPLKLAVPDEGSVEPPDGVVYNDGTLYNVFELSRKAWILPVTETLPPVSAIEPPAVLDDRLSGVPVGDMKPFWDTTMFRVCVALGAKFTRSISSLVLRLSVLVVGVPGLLLVPLPDEIWKWSVNPPNITRWLLKTVAVTVFCNTPSSYTATAKPARAWPGIPRMAAAITRGRKFLNRVMGSCSSKDDLVSGAAPRTASMARWPGRRGRRPR